MSKDQYGEVAEAAWGWVLEQVQWDDDGPWIPESAGGEKPTEYLEGMHSGIGGLAHVLAEIKLTRPWTADERRLAAAIADRIRTSITGEKSITYFDGLTSAIGVLSALDEPGSATAVERADVIATGNGWQETFLQTEKYLPDAVANDVTLGTASALLGSVWALRNGVPARPLADRAVELLLAEQEDLPTGLNWQFVSTRFLEGEPFQMPNFSHGLAGIAAALAVAGVELKRPELTDAARRGAEHLITLGTTDSLGFRVPRAIPWAERHGDEYTFNWCHGGAGTALLFSALEYAGIDQVAGDSPSTWHRRCLDGVRYSGIPERLHPGFWDNDGRCCGTAGVGDAFLDAWHRDGAEADLEFAVRLADTLLGHAHRDGDRAYWRFIEYRNDDPLLPPGVGWMQGAAGIAAYLFRVERVLGGSQDAVERMDNWWSLRR